MKTLASAVSLLMATVAVMIALSSCGLGHTHDFGNTEIVYEPGCTYGGEVRNYCECGEYYYTYTEPLGHIELEAVYENVNAPTCYRTGWCDAVVYCERCNSQISSEYVILDCVPCTNLKTEESYYFAPTCYRDGYRELITYCLDCGEEKSTTTELVEKIAHTPSEPVQENYVAPTYEADGGYDMVTYCAEAECKAELSRTSFTLDMLQHHPGEKVIENTVDPTCTAEGSYDEVVYCLDEDCGHKELSRTTVSLPMIEHNPGTPKTENEQNPTCTAEGKYDVAVYCTGCGKELSRESFSKPVMPHAEGSPKTENNVNPTCTTDGKYDTVIYCFGCGAELSRKTTTVSMLGHKRGEVVTENIVDSSCTEGGSYDEVVYCTNSGCGIELERVAKVIEPKGHDIALVARLEPTCNLPGNVEHWHCDTCSKNYVEAEALNELTNVVLTGGPHSFSDTLTANEEYHWYPSTCGHESEIIEKSKHKWNEGVLVGSGCTSGAYITYTCTVCAYQKNEAAQSHAYYVKESLEPTCTTDGYIVKSCSMCPEKEMTILYATGHSVDNPDSVMQPNCTLAGATSGYCSGCGEYISVTLEPKGHTPGEFCYLNDTCGEQSLGYIPCADCGEIIVEFGHSYQLTINQPTCSLEGSRVYECAVCHHTYSESIKASGHFGGEWVTVTEPGCDVPGRDVKYCLECGEECDERAVMQKEHSYSSSLVSGGISYTCSGCGDNYFVESSDVITIHFDTTGGSTLADLIINKGDELDLPYPEKEGHEFLGWYLDPENTREFALTSLLDSDTTLYAAWERSYLTGNYDTANIITGVAEDFTFDITSTKLLTDSNLADYVYVKDVNGNVPKIYIKSKVGRVYTIASDDYALGMTYTVAIRESVTFTETEGNEMWFVVDNENEHTISFKDGVVFIQEGQIYTIYEQDGKIYLLLREDMLDAGDNGVIYGDDYTDIALIFEVMAEGNLDGTASVYVIEAADQEDVFEEYNIYYSDGLSVDSFEFDDGLEEEIISEVKRSAVYSQFERVAKQYALGFVAGDYYYDFNGIKVTPTFKPSGNKIVFSVKIVAEYARMHTETREVQSLLHITLEIGNTLEFNMTAQVSSVNDFSFIIDVKDTSSVELYISMGSKGEKKQELNYFKALLLEAQKDGKNDVIDADTASQSKEITLGKLYVNYFGVTLSIDLTNTFSFDVSGQLGVATKTVISSRFGIKSTGGHFGVIRSFSSTTEVSFYVMGKINVSNTIKFHGSISLCGIVNAFVDFEVRPYVSLGGAFVAHAANNGQKLVNLSGYIELGIHLRADAGVNAKIDVKVLWWRVKVTLFDLKWNIYEDTFKLIDLGNKNMPLYFVTSNDKANIDYVCGESIFVGSYVDRTVAAQNLMDMKTSTAVRECKYTLTQNYPGITLSEQGYLTVDVDRAVPGEICVIVSYNGLSKRVYLTLSLSHDATVSPYDAPTCTEQGNTEYTYCANCKKLLAGTNEVIPETGHSFSTKWTSDSFYHWHASTCGHSVTSSYNAHKWNSGIVVTAETCTDDGLMRYTCTVCQRTRDEAISAHGHNYEVSAEVPSTCIALAYTEYTCSYCYDSYRVEYGSYSAHIFGFDSFCDICNYEKQSTGLKYTLSSDGQSYILSGIGTCTDTMLIIPLEYKGLPVTEIADSAFNGNTRIQSVSIGVNITHIGESAFESCTSLTEVYVPKSIKKIERYAFNSCSNLNNLHIESISDWCSIVFGNGVFYYDDVKVLNLYVDGALTTDLVITSASVASYAFYGFNGLTSVTLDSGVETVGDRAFASIATLQSVTFGDTVKYMDDYAFSSNRRLATVTLNEGLLTISEGAFYNCYSLTGIEIPASVTSIGNNAFFKNNSTQHYETVNGVRYMGNWAMEAEDKNASHITIREGTTGIADSAFKNMNSLTTVYIPTSVEYVGSYAFNGCSGLTSVKLTNVKNVGDYAFFGCTSLEDLNFSTRNLVNIGGYAFYGTAITRLDLASVEHIGAFAFGCCESLESVYIEGNTIKTIGMDAFYKCTRLTEFRIPSTVTEVGSYAFAYCESLTKIYMNADDLKIGNKAFLNCNKLKAVYASGIYQWLNITFDDIDANPVYRAGTLYINNEPLTYLDVSYVDVNDFAFAGCTTLESICLSIENNVGRYSFAYCDSLKSAYIDGEIIGEYAFYNCTSLSDVDMYNVNEIGESAFGYSDMYTVTIPATVTSIGNYAFTNYKLVEIINHSQVDISYSNVLIHTGESVVDNKDGYIFITTEGVNYLVSYIGTETELVLPENYNGAQYVIRKLAFNKNYDIVSVVIPDAVTEIGDSAFAQCSNLERVVIGNGVTSIGYSCFISCPHLLSITLGSSLTTLGSRALEGCNKLVEVINHSSISTSNITQQANNVIGIHVSDSRITYYDGGYVFYTANSGKHYLVDYRGADSVITLPEYFNGESYEIYKYAFGNCSSITKVTIPNTVTAIGSYTFSNCSSLTEVVIPENIDYVSEYMFYGCSSITEFVIPDHVTTIGEGAFEYCRGLTQITIPDHVTSVGSSAFEGCTALVEVHLGSGLSSISSYMFNGCTALVEVTMCEGIKSIGSYAFNNCYNINRLTFNIPESVEHIYSKAFSGVVIGSSNGVYYLDNWVVQYDGGYYGTTDIVILDGTVGIGGGVFQDKTSITGVTIPDSVKYIESFAFSGCTALKKVTIGSGVKTIGSSAFSGCTALSSLTISEGVSEIGSSAFSGCKLLASVVLPSSLSKIGNSAFNNCSSLSSITIPFVGETVDASTSNTHFSYIFGALSTSYSSTYVPTTLKTVVITGGTSIADQAFRNCKTITNVTIPTSVTQIGKNAFQNCTGLSKVTFENPTGWFATTSASATSGTNFYSDLSNSSTAASFLKNTYCEHYWKRNP